MKFLEHINATTLINVQPKAGHYHYWPPTYPVLRSDLPQVGHDPHGLGREHMWKWCVREPAASQSLDSLRDRCARGRGQSSKQNVGYWDCKYMEG